MGNVFIAAVAIAATIAQQQPASQPPIDCPAATTVGEEMPQVAGAIRRPGAHKGDYLPARTAANPVPANDPPGAALKNSYSNLKSQCLAPGATKPGTCDRAIAPKGTEAFSGGPSAQSPVPTSEPSDCDDSCARGLVTGQAGGTTNVKATASTDGGLATGVASGDVLLREQGCGPQN